jgi:carboxyl-terminal processing protease
MSRVSPARRLLLLSLVLVFLLGVFAASLPSTLAQMTGRGDFTDPINDVYRALMLDFVDKPDPEKLQKGAIDGMLRALDDDYAEFVPAADVTEFEKDLTGQYVGIGAQVEMRDGWLTIVSPLEDSPALKAGILPGDRVVLIGGETTYGLTIDQCIKKLLGEAGTQVKITVKRDGVELPYELTRAKVISRSVRGVRRVEDGKWDFVLDPEKKIAYVRLMQFIPTSGAEVAQALRDAQRQLGGTPGGLVLDLRNNPGGIMEEAIKIADMFLKEGVIMSTKGRGSPDMVAHAKDNGGEPEYPLVVLVNGSSASASEIVSGALQDDKRAIVLGTRTFGKGLVQTVRGLPHLRDAQVKFTTQRYYLPSGRLIQRQDDSDTWGVDPDPGFFVPMTDEQTIAWLTRRREWDVLKKDGPPGAGDALTEQKWNDPSWIEGEAKDPVLAAGLEALHLRLASGEWKPVSEEKEQHGKLAATELRRLERSRDLISREFLRIDKRIETLEKVAATGEQPDDKKDFWPDDTDLTGGTVNIYDKDGKVVAKLKITGRDVERWLMTADLAKQEQAAKN